MIALPSAMPFALHPTIDADALARGFTKQGRVRIRPFLEEDIAEALHADLRKREEWRQVLNSGDKLFELDRPTRADMSGPQKQALDEAVYAGARESFQYRYETIRLPDGDGPAAGGPAGFTHWLSSPEPSGLLRRISGCQDISFADGQATAYSPGDFLTAHDDDFAGKQRRAAYVLGLTPVWRVEWGGLLLFHGREDTLEGLMPSFNALDLFAVPQLHSVSLVSPAAAYRRYAITGWLRAGRG